ncbi:PTS system sucrose-specific IIA component, Glc family /PTS system sucrose-specific IIB component, Glc family /PTS system sucrose-specific IIC component, Glc family [Lachnospiraceae bacterium]|nr:PTS system sucrose-specific IIA component, Glc family /PTS system sucrose-specific IIB component, Glc family /PTS system sucrose-specific IIC component, Glc family [Lachnospiraceae bacterium]
MALDYRKCAEEIVANIGGRDNVAQAAHCATRLRLVIKDNAKINKSALENVDGVKGMFENNGQLQLIIGTGTVNKVYDEFLAVTGMTAATKDDVKAAAAAQQPAWKRALKSVGDVFVPILPAIVASGLMMGVVEALGKAIPSFAETDWYAFLDMVANTAFAFLPVIVAVSAARVFGANIFLAAVVGLMMVHTGLLNGWNVGNEEAINSFFGVTDGIIPTWNLFGSIKIGSYVLGSISRHGYQGHVIPVMIAIWFMSKIEKWLHKHVPEMIDLFVVPITTVFLTALITFMVVGPIFATLENYVLKGAEWLVQFPPGAMIMGAIYPATVVMGLHHMYNVIEAGMLSSVGLNTWMPIASAANFAQFGACLAVGIKCKKAKLKTVAIPSSMSAALGITEPAIFGVNFRFMKPFICGMIGGACGAIFGAITKIGATAYGVTGIPGYLTINNYGLYTILLLISGGIAFALTMIIWKEEIPEGEAEEPAPVKTDGAVSSKSEAKASVIKSNGNDVTKKLVITSSAGEISLPTPGKVIPYTDIPDPTFASGALGQGVGVEPEEGVVYAPMDGEISSVADSKHAIGISGENDQELLIHVGVDTVEMKGDGFKTLVEEGDQVKKGQKIMEFDIKKIKEAGHPDTVVVLLTNSDDYEDVKFGDI